MEWQTSILQFFTINDCQTKNRLNTFLEENKLQAVFQSQQPFQ